MPESPRYARPFRKYLHTRVLTILVRMQRWLAARGRFPEAKRSLAAARGIPAEDADDNWKIHREVSPRLALSLGKKWILKKQNF